MKQQSSTSLAGKKAEYYQAWQSYKKALKHKNKSIHDRVMNDTVYRDSQLKINWTEETCLNLDELAQQEHHYVASREERLRSQNTWRFTQRHAGRDTTVTRHRDYYKEALVKFREEKKTAVAKGEVVTQSTPWKDRAHQRSGLLAAASYAATSTNTTSKYDRGRPDAHAQQRDLRQSWWSSSTSHCWHGWQDWHSS